MEAPSIRQISRTYWWLLVIRALFAVLFISGIFEILAAFALRGLGIEWLLVISGILSIIVGIVFFAHPVRSILAIVWLIGVFALVHGVMLLIRAIRLRSLLTL